MNTTLSTSAKKVQDYLFENGFSCVVKEISSSTRTASDAASAIGCEIAQIAKSLIFMDKETLNPVLVIASGANLVDLNKIEKATGRLLIKADGTFVKERVGFAIGGIPPVGHKEKLKTYLDVTLKNYKTLWAAAGTPFAVFEIASDELQRMTDGEFVDLSL